MYMMRITTAAKWAIVNVTHMCRLCYCYNYAFSLKHLKYQNFTSELVDTLLQHSRFTTWLSSSSYVVSMYSSSPHVIHPRASMDCRQFLRNL